jgi:indolepyruvate ferredoxin oxidoreductase beta subunit
MKYDLIISGVGGQGILAIAMVLGRACLNANLQVRQSEIHGMAQRGGAVHSHFRISDSTICSDVIPHNKADMILAMEPMEALRYLPWLSADGRIIANSEPVVNIPNYPYIDVIENELKQYPNLFLFDGSKIANEAKASRALNMAMLGAASAWLPLDNSLLKEAITEHFQDKKAGVTEKNLAIFETAREAALSQA